MKNITASQQMTRVSSVSLLNLSVMFQHFTPPLRKILAMHRKVIDLYCKNFVEFSFLSALMRLGKWLSRDNTDDSLWIFIHDGQYSESTLDNRYSFCACIC